MPGGVTTRASSPANRNYRRNLRHSKFCRSVFVGAARSWSSVWSSNKALPLRSTLFAVNHLFTGRAGERIQPRQRRGGRARARCSNPKETSWSPQGKRRHTSLTGRYLSGCRSVSPTRSEPPPESRPTAAEVPVFPRFHTRSSSTATAPTWLEDGDSLAEDSRRRASARSNRKRQHHHEGRQRNQSRIACRVEANFRCLLSSGRTGWITRNHRRRISPLRVPVLSCALLRPDKCLVVSSSHHV